MEKTTKIILALAITTIFLLGTVVSLVVSRNSGSSLISVGTDPTGPFIENYIPIIQQNRGILTGFGIKTNSTLTAIGTTTLSDSVDGLVIGGGISTAATGTVITVHTNTTGPKLCDSSTGYLYVKNNGNFAPSLIWSMGTSTSAAAATGLVASTTVATTTSTIIAPSAVLFEYLQGDSLTVIFDDITNVSASTTNLSDWSAEAGIWCQDLSLSI